MSPFNLQVRVRLQGNSLLKNHHKKRRVQSEKSFGYGCDFINFRHRVRVFSNVPECLFTSGKDNFGCIKKQRCERN